MTAPKILVTGATGNCGGATLRALVRGGVRARAMTREPGRAQALAAMPGVEVVAGDFDDPAALGRALAGIEAVLLLPPHAPAMEAWQGNLIAAARRAGARHVVHVSGICADPSEPSISLGGHGRGERELEASGLAWTHLRPNSFFQNTLFDAASIAAEGRFYGCVADVRFAKIDTRDVGEVAAVCLTQSGHEGETYELSGPEALTYAELARTLSRVLGRPIEYVDMPSRTYVDSLRRAGLPEWLAEEFFLIYGQGPLFAGGAARPSDVVERLTGRPARTYEQWAREHAAAFAPA
ncbi:SDR family oxidoreductase [Nannocystis punicea]|uniref:SDR family oxidoreductase n=1 Tax=Nannocystis punicea TaxID=2995304 RepID=A0ABY7H741_9BACT|nr:SDR family oxidoreductase [Nannocystis poenicansa]WAS94892.1 SDR family oxidoreductase [Nannocystis poenicansa]